MRAPTKSSVSHLRIKKMTLKSILAARKRKLQAKIDRYASNTVLGWLREVLLTELVCGTDSAPDAHSGL